MEKQKVILMIANSDTAVNGFMALTERYEARNDIKSIIICHPRVHIQPVREKCRGLDDRIQVLDFDERQRIKDEKSTKHSEYHYKKDIFVTAVIKSIVNVMKIVLENRQGLRKAKKICRDTKPDIILLYADNKSELEKFFIYLAKKKKKKKKIKTVVAPICLSDIEGILFNPTNGFRIGVKEKLPLTAKIVEKMNPRNEKIYQGERVFLQQPFSYIIHDLMGMSVPNPWVQGSLADIVCTAYQEEFSEITRELGKENVAGRLFLTESVEDGIIIDGYQNRELLRRRLAKKYHLESERIAIIAFSERISNMSKENDLFNKGIIVQSVLKYYDEVLISLHPKSDVKENMFLEEYEGCHIAEEPLRKIIGAADLMIYGDLASVSRWADMLQINRVVYETYSMQAKWTDAERRDFEEKLAAKKNQDKEAEKTKLERGIDFAEFILNVIEESKRNES